MSGASAPRVGVRDPRRRDLVHKLTGERVHDARSRRRRGRDRDSGVAVSEPKLDRADGDARREPRPCKRCGWVRVVRVRDRNKYVTTGTRVNHLCTTETVGHFVPDGETYNETCTLCEYEATAEKYRRLASEWQRRADAIRVTRSKK